MPEGEVEPAAGEDTHAPSRVKVKIAGSEFEVDADLAKALEQREDQFSRKLSEQGQELGQFRQMVANLTATVAAPRGPEPARQETDEEFYRRYNELAIEEPAKAARLLEERVEGRLSGRYLQDQRQRDRKAAWDRQLDAFYRANPDLDGEDMLVDAVHRDLYPQLQPLWAAGRIDEAMQKVADETRLRIYRLTQKFGKKGESPKPTSQGSRMAVVEGGGPVRTGGGGAEEEESEDQPSKSLSEAIRRKQSRTRRGSNTVIPGRKRRTPTVV